jgi:hypothetical protein
MIRQENSFLKTVILVSFLRVQNYEIPYHNKVNNRITRKNA